MKNDKWERIPFAVFSASNGATALVLERKRGGLPYWPYRCNGEIRWGWK